jgi:outer membrane immunogenic protein
MNRIRNHLMLASFAFAVLACVSTSSLAADVSIPVTPDWTGFHIGVGAGYGMLNHELNLDVGGGAANLDWSGIGGEGSLATVEAGFDYQITPQFLIGVLADYTLSGMSTDLDGSINGLGSARYELEASESVSVLLRGGTFVDSSTLMYGLVGWTHTWFNGDLDVEDNLGNNVLSDSYGFDVGGLTFGGGLESAIANNVTLKLEYRYTMYDGVDIIDIGPIGLDAHPGVQTIRAVLSYRMGDVYGNEEAFEEGRWTGLRIGLGGGYGMVNHVLEAESALLGGADIEFSGVGGEGLFGTIEVGADYQIGERFVVGVQADYTMSGISTDIDGEIAGLGSASYELEASDSFSVLGRFGMLSSPNVLWFGLAGWTHTSFNGDVEVEDNVGNTVYSESYNFDADGLTVGVGFEAMLTESVSWKTEYRYTSYDTVEILDLGRTLALDANTNSQSVRSTLSWRF